MNDDLLRFVPPKPELAHGTKWHVFLSYRQSDRDWALQLHDALRQLDYQVFLDQFVLKAGDLLSQLEHGLEQSASGIIVWSGTSADSKWLQTEYSLMQTFSTDRGFRYVVANLAASRPPLFASNALWVDFSSATDGPHGMPLLTLLWGLAGRTLPEEALRSSLELDDRVTRDKLRIRTYVESRNADEIVAMARSADAAWTSTPLLGVMAAEGLIRIARYTEAISILAPLRERFPNSVRPVRLLSLALLRLGRTDESLSLLAGLYQAGARDSETLGMYARTWMDRYRGTGDRTALERARDLYAEAFKKSPNDAYLGLNAASTNVFLGDLLRAQQIAERVKSILDDARSDDFWNLATKAEAELISRQFDAAANAYEKLSIRDRYASGSLESVRAQATRLLDNLAVNPEQRAVIMGALT